MTMRAVIFDLDGVLTDTVENHYRSWKQAIAPYGIEFTRKDNEKLLGLNRRKSLEVIMHCSALANGNMDGLALDSEEMDAVLEEKNRLFLEAVGRMSPQDVLPGVERLIGELREAGIAIGVASGSRNAKPVLEQIGLLPAIGAVVDSNSVQSSKPAPDVFLQTARLLGAHPEECVVMEDSEAGIQAALAARMCVLGLGNAERLRYAHAVFQSMEQVNLRMLKGIHGLWARFETQRIAALPPRQAKVESEVE